MRVLPPLIGAMCTVLLCGCVTPPPKPQPTPLQLQAYQMREFEVDKTTALGSVITVFQDLGYIIQSADKETGFVTAASPSKSGTDFVNILVAIAGGASRTNSVRTRATAFIEELRPNLTSVRLNFVVNEVSSSTQGQVIEDDTPVTDPQAYQIAFSRIEDAVFIRTRMRSPAPAAPVPVPAAQTPGRESPGG
jgi:hypothetical protein